MQQAIQADFSVVNRESFVYPDNNDRSISRETLDVTPDENSEFAEEETLEDEENPFEDVDPETGEVLQKTEVKEND